MWGKIVGNLPLSCTTRHRGSGDAEMLPPKSKHPSKFDVMIEIRQTASSSRWGAELVHREAGLGGEEAAREESAGCETASRKKARLT